MVNTGLDALRTSQKDLRTDINSGFQNKSPAALILYTYYGVICVVVPHYFDFYINNGLTLAGPSESDGQMWPTGCTTPRSGLEQIK